VLGGLVTLSRAIHPKQGQSVGKATAVSAAARLPLASRNEDRAKDAETVAEALVEGARVRVEANLFERNAKARRVCIKHYGATCSVCGFTFEKVYGPLADGFIHVHHIRPVATVGEEYEIDPIADLRPLCPNCHAVVHLREPAMKLDDLADLLRKHLKCR
jgi:predicted HNH restriction endonuclease